MDSDWLKETVTLVARYVAHNPLAAEEVGALTREVHGVLRALDRGAPAPAAPPPAPQPRRATKKAPQPPQPRVSAAESWSETTVTCMICGKSCQVLTGHLSRIHRLDPGQYRLMFGLAKDHPLVAPRYSDKRRVMAKENNQAEKMLKGRRAAAAPAP